MPNTKYKLINHEDIYAEEPSADAGCVYYEEFKSLKGLILSAAEFRNRTAIFARMNDYGVFGADLPMRLFISRNRNKKQKEYKPLPKDALDYQSTLSDDEQAIAEVANLVYTEGGLERSLKFEIAEIKYSDQGDIVLINGDTIYEISESRDCSMSSVIKCYQGSASVLNCNRDIQINRKSRKLQTTH